MNIVTCADKKRLAEEYETATAQFAEAVSHLQRNIGTSTREEYEGLQRLANEARLGSEQARLRLEAHTAIHNC
jgi:hypothetical protein